MLNYRGHDNNGHIILDVDGKPRMLGNSATLYLDSERELTVKDSEWGNQKLNVTFTRVDYKY